jgi:Ni,Fe-hydrogenase III small subunit
MRRLLAPLLAGALLLPLAVTPTLAVGLHQHYLTLPSGQVVEIAVGICENDLQGAIDNLHEHFHLGSPTAAFAENPVAFSVTGCP